MEFCTKSRNESSFLSFKTKTTRYPSTLTFSKTCWCNHAVKKARLVFIHEAATTVVRSRLGLAEFCRIWGNLPEAFLIQEKATCHIEFSRQKVGVSICKAPRTMSGTQKVRVLGYKLHYRKENFKVTYLGSTFLHGIYALAVFYMILRTNVYLDKQVCPGPVSQDYNLSRAPHALLRRTP